MTRARTFQECPRRYCYRYLLAPHARRPGASPLASRVDLVKSLVGLEAWAGSVVHSVIEAACGSWRRARPFGEDEAAAHALRLLRTQYRNSREYWTAPEESFPTRPVLLDLHHYGEGRLSPEHGGRIRRKVLRAVEQFLGSELAERIRSTGPSRWLPVDRNASFRLPPGGAAAGLLVLVKPDFAFRDDGRLHLLDWKTGSPDPFWETVQLACYALYAREKWGAPLEELAPRIVQLYPEYHVSPCLPTEESIREVIGLIRETAGELPEAGAGEDEPRPEEYEPARDPRQCGWCPFRGMCEASGWQQKEPAPPSPPP